MVQTLQNTVEVPQFQLVGFFDLVVDISVVVQRQIPMVLFRTTEFFQLQYTDKVIDGCAARVLASRCRVVVDFSLPVVLTILFGTVSGR